MILPKRNFGQRGQILIIFLLLLVVGLAIVLSVASRTITDVRTSTTSDESNRAYFAAEAGIEEALQSLQSSGTVSDFQLSFQNVADSTTQIQSSTDQGTTFIYPDFVKKDDVAQVMMLRDGSTNCDTPDQVINDTDLTCGWTGQKIKFYWGSKAYSIDPNQAIEVSIISYNTTSGAFGVTKFGFDPNSSHNNNFCNQNSGVHQESGIPPLSDPVSLISRPFYFSAILNIVTGAVGPSAVDDCTGATSRHGPGIGSADPVFIRIRPLYNAEPVPIAIVSSDSPVVPFPTQGVVITSTGRTASGVTRKLKVTRLYPALPALFDYVLFNGSSVNALEK